MDYLFTRVLDRVVDQVQLDLGWDANDTDMVMVMRLTA
jgi:hypothetical protein